MTEVPNTSYYDLESTVSFGGWEWDDNLREWGKDTVLAGGGIVAAGGGIAMMDSPLPGPADVIGGAVAASGFAAAVVGAHVYAVGTVGGVIDWLVND